MECYWNRNTEYSLAQLEKASHGVAVIPLASIESHGPHLPLGSDTHCVDHLVGRVLEKETVAVLPTLEYTCVDAARSLPGAIHLRSDLLMDMVESICDEVYRNGFSKIVLLHGHGGNVFLHTAFVKRMLEREKPYAVYSIPVLAGVSEEMMAMMESDELGHACEFETSMNRVACPEEVDLNALGTKTFSERPGPDVGSAATPVDYISRNPEMAKGEPQKATREKGEKCFELWADAVVRDLRLIKKDDVVPSTIKAYIANANGMRPRKRDE